MPDVASTRPSVVVGRLRWLAALVSVGLLLTPLTPWYARSVTAPTLHGHRRVVVGFTGSQALSLPAVVCALLGLGLAVLLALRARTRVEGLGAAGRRAARGRTDGALVAGGGAICVVLIIGTLIHPGGAAATLPGATAATTVRWGLGLALVVALVLTALGVVLSATARAAARSATVTAATGRPATGSGSIRLERVAPTAVDVVAAAEPERPASGPGPAGFDFDFPVSDDPAIAARARERRRRAGTFTRSSR